MAFTEVPPTLEEAMKEIRTKPVVSAWPIVGVVLGLSRGATYDAVARGDIDTVKLGRPRNRLRFPWVVIVRAAIGRCIDRGSAEEMTDEG